MTPVDPDALAIAHTIQLAFAPALLLSVVGVLLGVLSNRLMVVLERVRKLDEPQATEPGPTDPRQRQEQVKMFLRRARLLNLSITLMVLSGLLVAIVVLSIFLNEFVAADFSRLIAILFMVAMLCLIGSLLTFLRDVFLAINALNIGMRH